MITHISSRLVWHDRGWDGHICDAPHLNAACIVNKFIRQLRNDEEEKKWAGKHLADLKGYLPPCSRDPGAYSARGFQMQHLDPWDRGSQPTFENIPPYSWCPSPYRWMREENFATVIESEGLDIPGPTQPKDKGWVLEENRQEMLLRAFWGKLQPKQSLVFFYCDQASAVDDSIQKIIVGVGRIAEVGDQVFYESSGDKRLPVWARRLSQAYPEEGVRIPYQEYVRAGLPTDTIRCDVPANARGTFSFVAEHLTDDDAVAILERVIQSIETVRSEGKIAGDWKRQLAWLNRALSEVWVNRGAFPGIGSVLRFLGFDQAFSFQRDLLVPMAQKGKNPLEYVRALLSGEKEPKNASYAAGIAKARNEWKRGEGRQALLEQLMRFQVSPDQVERIVNPDLRQDSGITAQPKEIVENPYLVAEQDRGHKKSNPIALETIDQGMLPEGEAVRFMGEDPIRPDDQRRVRAVCHSVLKEAARDAGDTVVTLPDLMAKVRDRFPEKRRCAPDPEIFIAEKAFNEAILEIATADEIQIVGLKQLSALEQHIASVIRRRVGRSNPDPVQPIDWRKALESPQVFGKPKTNREKAAIDEKEAALRTLFSRRVSVLTGGAGTGKTSVIRVLLHVLEKVDGKQPMLLLAPTGKARVRLATRTKRLANTIHQFLLRQDWIVPPSFALKSSSSKPPESATTVVIDECSMIPTDLFGTLLKAVDTNHITRLILVGDPNQLPPIGPGRPFVDIVDWFEREHAENVAHLVTAMRAEEVNEGGQLTASTALDFANGFRTTDAVVDDDELLSCVARGETRGDLVSLFWDDHADAHCEAHGGNAASLGN